DHADPPANLWSRITKKLDEHEQPATQPTVRKMVARVLKIAAVVFLIGFAGIVVYFYGKKTAYDDYYRINPQLATEQQAYSQLILQKKDSVAVIATGNPLLYNEFSTALSHIEHNYETLKQEFENSPNKERILEAMIRNLQAQMNILSQQMEVLRDIEITKSHPQNEQI